MLIEAKMFYLQNYKLQIFNSPENVREATKTDPNVIQEKV